MCSLTDVTTYQLPVQTIQILFVDVGLVDNDEKALALPFRHYQLGLQNRLMGEALSNEECTIICNFEI